MTTSPVILRNDVLQYGMNHRDELDGGILSLPTPFSLNGIQIHGCTWSGELIGTDNSGTKITVPYNDLGLNGFSSVFVELYNKYCSS